MPNAYKYVKNEYKSTEKQSDQALLTTGMRAIRNSAFFIKCEDHKNFNNVLIELRSVEFCNISMSK